MSDPKLRKAIEQHAVEQARQYYFGRGATEIEELGKPYDLRIVGLGAERHAEVKGSCGTVSGIELTVNEVMHAHNHVPTDLVIVDEIEYRTGPEAYVPCGGRLRVWLDWRPERERLSPTRFRYALPTE